MYIHCLAGLCMIFSLLSACQEEWTEQGGQPHKDVIAEELSFARAYEAFELPAHTLDKWDGYRIRSSAGFVFVSDSVVQRGRPITVEVEQNPFEEERSGYLEFYDTEGHLCSRWRLKQAGSLTQTQGKAYSSALQRSYGVGYGYDAFGEYASYNSVRDQVISLPALRQYEEEHHTSCLVDDFIPDMTTSILEGTDSQKLLKSLSAQAGLGLDIGFFQAHVQVGYASSDLKSNAYSFCTIMNHYKAASRHFDPYSLMAIARSYPQLLTVGFRHVVGKITEAVHANRLNEAADYTEELFRIFGTHLIYHADLGGKLEFCSTFERASLDSKTSLSVAAEASFLNLCGFKMEQGQENTYSQVSERHSRSLSARGGEVTYTTEIINCEKDVLDAGLVEKWYRSIRMDFEHPEKSNVELIDFQLFPVYQFVTDEAARSFIYAYLGEQVDEQEASFPRVFDTCYKRIATDGFYRTSSKVEYLESGGQVIAEAASEQIRLNHKDYQLHTLYPVLMGEVRHEGLAVDNDSIYRILWKGIECTLVPIGKRMDYPTLYYNNGDLDTEPVPEMQKYTADYAIHTLSLYSWQNWYDQLYKYGPYLVMEGPHANSKDSKDHYKVVVADRPAGWDVMTRKEVEYLESLHDKYHIKQLKHGLADKQFYFVYEQSGADKLMNLQYHIDTPCLLNTVGAKNLNRPLLYVRASSFRY